MLSSIIVIEAFKQLCSSVHLVQINCWVFGDWAFEVTLHSSSARLDGIYPSVQIQLIGIWNSPDHYSIRNEEVKVIGIYSLGPRFSVRCLY